MEIELDKKPKDVIIVEGFPGMGLVGTIATEAILEHLGAKAIGRIVHNKLPALVAVHEEKVVEPLGIFYDPKTNIVIQHAVTNVSGIEWELSNSVVDLANQLKAKEIISLEGISTVPDTPKKRAFYYTNNTNARKKFEKLGLKPLKDGIIVGVTGTLMLKASNKFNMSAIFAETRSGLPDSRAAAVIIEIVDSYLNLKIPYEPLLKKAQQFEDKLKNIFEKSKQAVSEKEKKEERVGYIE
ncbi:MAG: PAC2 family protein [Nanoarchaeota archaeon]